MAASPSIRRPTVRRRWSKLYRLAQCERGARKQSDERGRLQVLEVLVQNVDPELHIYALRRTPTGVLLSLWLETLTRTARRRIVPPAVPKRALFRHREGASSCDICPPSTVFRALARVRIARNPSRNHRFRQFRPIFYTLS